MKHATKVAPLILYSAHDSTLIGLLCALKLESPKQWPGYGEYLKVELLECGRVDESGDVVEKEHFVRFSLSGNVLRLQWDSDPVEMIRLDDLENKIAGVAASHDNKLSGVDY
jgi:acid phosphatase